MTDLATQIRSLLGPGPAIERHPNGTVTVRGCPDPTGALITLHEAGLLALLERDTGTLAVRAAAPRVQKTQH